MHKLQSVQPRHWRLMPHPHVNVSRRAPDSHDGGSWSQRRFREVFPEASTADVRAVTPHNKPKGCTTPEAKDLPHEAVGSAVGSHRRAGRGGLDDADALGELGVVCCRRTSHRPLFSFRTSSTRRESPKMGTRSALWQGPYAERVGVPNFQGPGAHRDKCVCCHLLFKTYNIK